MMDEVDAISTSFGRNPLLSPSTLTKNLSPLNNRLEPISVIVVTISSKLFLICFAIETRFIPNKRLIAEDAKTGSLASTIIIEPSFFKELNSSCLIFRIFFMFSASNAVLFSENIDGNTTTYEFSFIFT